MEEATKKPFLLAIFTSRYRALFGVIIFSFLLIGVLYLAWIVPGQLSKQETQSALSSATLSLDNPSTTSAIDLPYQLLQKASLHYFGITTFAIKLPSLFLGLLTGLGILWLLKSWLLRSSIALFTGVIAVTSSQFLLVASTGTALIMPLFWIVVLFLLALKLSSNQKSLLWSLGAALAFGLSLYTPLSLYFVIALLVAAVLHPRLRHALRTIPLKNNILALLLLFIVLVPLIIALYKHPSLGPPLLGWPGSSHSLGQIKFNILELAKSYFQFWQPQLTTMGLTPIFGLGSFCLIIFGGLKIIVDHHSARTYSLAILLPILLVPILLQPKYAVILFVPLILLLAVGVEALLDEWYKLFPHNPYARVVALVPVTILLVSLVISNVSYYASGLRFVPNLPMYYSQDLGLARQAIKTHPDATLVVSSDEKSFYSLLKRDYPNLGVVAYPENLSRGKPAIVASSSGLPIAALGAPQQIITDSYRSHPPRFYVFAAR